MKKSVGRSGCAKPADAKESADMFKSDNPAIQKKLTALKSLEGIWANKDTSFFDRKHE